MKWDEAKRQATFELRGLDFAHAGEVLGGVSLTIEDDRQDYGETRYQTIGKYGLEIVLVVWTP